LLSRRFGIAVVPTSYFSLVARDAKVNAIFPSNVPSTLLIPAFYASHWVLCVLENNLLMVMNSMVNHPLPESSLAKLVSQLKLHTGRKEIEIVDVSVPQQGNLCDCGVFLLFFSRCLAERYSINHCHVLDTKKFRIFLASEVIASKLHLGFVPLRGKASRREKL